MLRPGVTFLLQIGQALSSRPDVLPPEYITELEVLQDRIPPFSNDEALQVGAVVYWWPVMVWAAAAAATN